MNIGNITSNNFNLDGNGKDMQIEVYEQLIEQLQQENKQLKENYKNIDKGMAYLMEQNNLYKSVIDEVIEYIKTCNPNVDLYSEFLDESYISNYGAIELLEILDKAKESDK